MYRKKDWTINFSARFITTISGNSYYLGCFFMKQRVGQSSSMRSPRGFSVCFWVRVGEKYCLSVCLFVCLSLCSLYFNFLTTGPIFANLCSVTISLQNTPSAYVYLPKLLMTVSSTLKLWNGGENKPIIFGVLKAYIYKCSWTECSSF
jgi:hypothetical protein